MPTKNEKRELSFTNLRIRSADNTDGRTVEGIAVPFGEIIDVWGDKETFSRDTIFDGIENAKLCYQHGELIGKITHAEPRDEGLFIQARIADTATGRDVVSLLDDGALDAFSIGFQPESFRWQDDILIYERVRMLETSIVSWPAYSQAKITDHRSQPLTTITEKENPMSDDIKQLQEQVAERGTQIDSLIELTRAMQAKLDTPQAAASDPLERYESFGSFVKNIYSGDEQARNDYMNLLNRSLTAAGKLADTDSQPQWVADHIQLVQSSRTVTNLVTHEALPAQGMKLDYLKLKSNTTVVKKINEGDDLPFGKIELEDASAQVETFGGYTTVSRHVIDRATTPYLDTLLRAMALAYAKNTENGTRTALYEAIKAIQDTEKIKTSKALASMQVADWISVIVDAAEILDERSVAGVTLGVSKDVYTQLATLSISDRPLMDISGHGTTQVGSLNLTGITGELMNYPVQLMPKADAGTAAFISKDSVTMWESANAPFQLQADRVIDLGRDMSLYGYAAFGVTNPAGLLPISFGAR